MSSTLVSGPPPFDVSRLTDFVLACTRHIRQLETELDAPNLTNLVREFLQDQLYPDADLASNIVGIDQCPEFDGKMSVYHSARAFFYAPSELAGAGGMHVETIRSNPRWYGDYERRDTVLIQAGTEDEVMGGLTVGRVRAFLGFEYDNEHYPCALVEWFSVVGDAPDPITGMWIVTEPDKSGGRACLGLIHLDCIFRSCLLIGLTRKDFLPRHFHYSNTHTAFKAFYLNKYADYHSHETHATQ